jgi:hypothetical protein
MKLLVLFLVFLMPGFLSNAQPWTAIQFEKANTAENVNYLSRVEKDVILYINLARMYPAQFAENEVRHYYGPSKYGEYLKNSEYRSSLIEYLNHLKPTHPLLPDNGLYQDARCFAKESGESGYVGHDRKKCPPLKAAECCSYGMEEAKDIVLQLLIDHDVPSLGHRLICLDKSYFRIGVSRYTHTVWEFCAVANFGWAKE